MIQNCYYPSYAMTQQRPIWIVLIWAMVLTILPTGDSTRPPATGGDQSVLDLATPTSSSSSSVSSAPLSPVDLPFGDINVLIVTDTHSWVAGHGARQREYDADYGAVLSFYESLRDYCQQNNRTFFFVMNGDWVDGTGLAMNGDPSYLIPILQKMPWDAINVGNHELYRRELIEYITRPAGFVEFWEGRYLSSNVVRSNSQKPLGNLYRVLRGINQNVLTFGFLFNMQGNADIVTVKQVETVVQEDWFSYALHHEKFGAIMVLAHMGFGDPLLQTILSKIRKELGDDMPVQFITGHTHIRNFTMLDDASSSFEAGRFLDTVGFVSFPSRTTYTGINASAGGLFRHKYLDANIQTLQETLGVPSLATEQGQALTEFISQVRKDLNLDELINCLEGSLYLDRSLTDTDSLWRFFREQVVTTRFPEPAAVFMHKGSWRYDLIAGGVRVDDAIGVSPYNYSYVEWKGIPGSVLLELNRSMNEHPETNYLVLLPNYILSLASNTYSIDDNSTFNLIMQLYEAKGMQTKLEAIYPEAAEIALVILNQTTTSVWMDYFRSRETCSSPSDPKTKPHSTSKMNSTELDGSTDSTDKLIPVKVVLAALAIASILTLIGVCDREHSGRCSRQDMEALPQETQDNEDDEESGDLDEKGEFI